MARVNAQKIQQHKLTEKFLFTCMEKETGMQVPCSLVSLLNIASNLPRNSLVPSIWLQV